MKFHSLFPLLILTLLLSITPSTFVQGEALLELKSYFTEDPYGGLLSWGSSVHYSSWTGITCSDGTEGQIVIAIDLSGLNLAETISPAIGANSLTTLQPISLARNRLTDVLPSSLSCLSNLQYLNLSHNNLSSPIPSFLGSLLGMVNLDRSDNNFSGPLPTIFAFHPNNCLMFKGNPHIISTTCKTESKQLGLFGIKLTVAKILGFIFAILTGGGSVAVALKNCRWSLEFRAGNENFRGRPSRNETDHPMSVNPSESASPYSEIASELEMT